MPTVALMTQAATAISLSSSFLLGTISLEHYVFHHKDPLDILLRSVDILPAHVSMQSAKT